MAFVATLLLFGALTVVLYIICASAYQSVLARRSGCQSPPERRARDPIFALDHKVQDFKVSRAYQGGPTGLSMFRKYGPTYQTTTLLNTRIRTIDPTNIQAVWGHQYNDWGIQPSRLAGMAPFCGQGFITTDGPVWERSKALLRPSFHRNNISNFKSFETSVAPFLAQLPKDDRTVDLQPLFSLLFFESAKRFLIGDTVLDESDKKTCPVDGATFLEAFQKSMRGCGMRIMLGPMRFLVPKTMSVEQWEIVHSFIDFYVGRVLRGEKSARREADQPASLLDNLVAQTKDRVEIRNQMIQAMMAAQDTTAALMSNVMFLLARNKAIWTRLQDEVASIDTRSLTLEDLKPLSLLQNILKEALRLYPVFGSLGRTALKDTILPTGGGTNGDQPVFAKAGTKFFAHFYTLHRNEDVFGPDAESFRPDRWNTINPSHWQYMPFGGGHRSCLGQQKAMSDASYLLIRMLQTFKGLESRDDRDWAGDSRLTTWNANGCQVALLSR